MGQHIYYPERYPEEFNIFSENDYLDLPLHQRKTIAEYDNATLYNDFVIDSIIHIFSKKEAIILYFSDHGQDIYFSDKDYCGHGITANAKSDSIGRDIPFMIYTSPKFKDKYPSLIEKIINSTNKKFNIEDIIYTLIDISGYKFKDNNDVERYSILSN
jgi:heptose-I-phosphate ethanolaminephosphotransferase